MECPNCKADIEKLPADMSVWCKRCGTHAVLLTSGHLRRIRIPTLTQQLTPAECRELSNNDHPISNEMYQ